jgi:heparan sulfate 6-O-sulfotransferase HS6ST1
MKIEINLFKTIFFSILLYLLLFICIFTNEKSSQSKTLIEKNELLIYEASGYFDSNIFTIEKDFNFGEDTFAQIHIQKTGGTAFENHLLNDLQILRNGKKWESACTTNLKEKRKVCKYAVFKKHLIRDRYTCRNCDIHADFTELHNCIMQDFKNRISYNPIIKMVGNEIGIPHFITFLREPIHRYVSEYEHIKRGAVWSKSVRACINQPIYSNKCYSGKSWNKTLTWKNYLDCEYNQANNRQVRMLANYNILGCNVLKCLTKSSKCSIRQKYINQQKLLLSAKRTLIDIDFFGLVEYQKLSEYLFIKTFSENKFKFSVSAVDLNETIAMNSLNSEAGSNLEQIAENNHLDIQLYQFAKELFFKRIEFFMNLDTVKN